MIPRARVVLLLVAGLSSVIGALFLVLPPALGRPTPAPLLTDVPGALPHLDAGDPVLAEDVVLANVFSARRAPPTTRYAPPDATMDSSGGALADPSAESELPDTATGEPMLLGTVVGVHGTQALLQLDPFAGSPRLYAVGDRDGAYRVIAIAPRSVILAGPRGRVTLRLDQEEERP